MECIVCGCTELTPCLLPEGPCAWALVDPPVCNNPRCMFEASAEIVAANVSVVGGRVVLELGRLGEMEPFLGWLTPDGASDGAQAIANAAALARLAANDAQDPVLFDAGGAPIGGAQ